MAARIFIDGAAGTTGLEIRERLADRGDIALIQLADAERKNPRARREALNDSDLVILCLPDDAAREAVAMVENPSVRIIDASTAHRVAPDWVFGFPELEPGQRERIASATRLSNPGCYSTGFLALARPLVRAGLIPPDFPLTVNAVSGYSGGGKSMIEEFENRSSPRYVETVVRIYGLSLAHKHVPEMQKHAGLAHSPVFAPSVGRFYRGMIVEVPLQLWALPGKPDVFDLHRVLADAYRGEKLIEVAQFDAAMDALKAFREGREVQPPVLASATPLLTIDAEMLRLTNGMKLFVFGNDKTHQARLVAVLDNLGKGASGAAVQNLNIMLGLPETTGLL
jgi:N-acetyl-gamma-glutamyl-phosphate reductase